MWIYYYNQKPENFISQINHYMKNKSLLKT